MSTAPLSSAAVWPFLVGTGVLLGTGLPIARLAAAQGIEASTFTLWTALAAAGLLAALAALRRGPIALTPALLRFGATAGLIGHALPMTAAFWLASHAGTGFSSLAFTLPPVFTLAISLLLGHERLQPARLAAVAIGLLGAWLLLVGRSSVSQGSPLALTLVLAIPALIGAGNVYRARKLPPGVAGEWLASLTLMSSAIVLLVAGLFTGTAVAPPTPMAWTWLGAQTVALVGGYLLYFELQRRAEPVTFSLMGYVMMLTGVAAGSLWFGERQPWTVWPALALILFALHLIQRRR